MSPLLFIFGVCALNVLSGWEGGVAEAARMSSWDVQGPPGNAWSNGPPETEGAWGRGQPKSVSEPAKIGEAWGNGPPKSVTEPAKTGGVWAKGPPTSVTEPVKHQPVLMKGKSSLNIMTWNVENLKSDGGQHQTYITAALQHFIIKSKPDVVVLQEVEACDLVAHALPDWACVGSVVPEHVETNLPHIVLGNVILYNTRLFVGAKPNRVLTTGFKAAARRLDRSGKNLFDHHGEKCSWEEYNGCKNAYADMPSATSVKLFLREDAWATEVRALFPAGLRVVNVHLFAGGRHGGLSEAGKAQRRRFQMRSLMSLVNDWNAKDTAETRSSNLPVTIYAGDFNTRRKHELQDISAPADDYGMRLWCPADGGWCDTALSKYKTHKAGTLDHVTVDIQREVTSSPFLGRASVLRQPTSGRGRGGSDHDPLFVQMKPSPSAARPSTNQAPPVLNDDSFPSLSG